MFELIVAWSLFTFVLGKGVESVTHAVKGTTPPRTQERIAKHNAHSATDPVNPPSTGGSGDGRSTQAASHARRGQDSAALGYVGRLWEDHWILQAQKHADRWPDKATKARRKAAEKAANRDATWEEVQQWARRRWDERRAQQDTRGSEPPAPVVDQAEQDELDAEIAERVRRQQTPPGGAEDEGAADPPGDDPLPDPSVDEAHRDADVARRYAQHLREELDAENAEPQDQDPAAPGPGRSADPEGGRVIAFPTPETSPAVEGGADTEGAQMEQQAEVLGLGGCTRLTEQLVRIYQSNAQALDTRIKYMQDSGVGSDIMAAFGQVHDLTEQLAEAAERALQSCQRMQGVREAFEAVPDSGDKDFVAPETTR